MSDNDLYLELVCGDLNGPCPRCGEEVSLHVAETVEGNQVMWTATSRCVGCRYTDVMRERPAVHDALDAIIRQTLIARVGRTRLHAEPDDNRNLRLRALAVFRGRGATIAGAADAYATRRHGRRELPAGGRRGQYEIPAGVFRVERREGGPDRHFRCEVGTLEEVSEIFRGYLANQDGWGGRQWKRIRL